MHAYGDGAGEGGWGKLESPIAMRKVVPGLKLPVDRISKQNRFAVMAFERRVFPVVLSASAQLQTKDHSFARIVSLAVFHCRRAHFMNNCVLAVTIAV